MHNLALSLTRPEEGAAGDSRTFDVDRCDYLLRDAHFTGVSYGTFDLDWLVRSLRYGHPAEADAAEAPQAPLLGRRGDPGPERDRHHPTCAG